MRHPHAILPMLLAVMLLALLFFANGRSAVGESAAETVDYGRDIQPLLARKCGACHGALQQVAGLRLDAGSLIRQGGNSGPAIEPGDGSGSLLIERVSESDSDLRMPPEGEGEPLTAAQIDLLRRWIDAGAPSPDDEPIPDDPKNHWSYQPAARPAVPTWDAEADRAAAWVRDPIDAFVAAKHQQLGLSPRPEAAREVWLRRVFLDLIGIPPTRSELHAFLADNSPDAYETVVDQLLERPEYGERWGRHWMDVWRYSDWYGSRGINEIRYGQRHLWRWRDWIVESLIADKPYDQMLMEMLAADEIAADDPDALRATGFLGRNWYKFDRNVWLFDTVEHTGQAFLGLTLRCCRCHDHKFDPISQLDYYRFRAFFEPHDVRTDPLSADPPKEKDNTLGMVLADGIARVYDKQPDAKTFLFRRGDDRSPDESRPLPPAVPPALGGEPIAVKSVALPPQAFYPSLRPEIADGMIAAAEADVRTAEQKLRDAEQAAAEARQAVLEREARLASDHADASQSAAVVFSDDFAKQTDHWKPVSGNWSWNDGKLVENSVGSFATIVAPVTLPRDFRARVRYRTLQPGMYRSVGFSFDYLDPGNSQDVYTSANDSAPSIQAFHRQNGKQQYPQAGIVKTPVPVGEVVTVEAVARGQSLNLYLNGELKLEYVMPVARQQGQFALWVHQGSAEFLDVEVRKLVPSLEDLRRQAQRAKDQVSVADSERNVARLNTAAVRARVAAERAKYLGGDADRSKQSAAEAARAEGQLSVAKAEHAALQAKQHLETLRAASSGETAAAAATAIEEAANKLRDAEQALAAARTEAETNTSEASYTPLGEVYPPTSTGRRAALARWIASPENPRTARVAVNHIWLRHFGQALVPTVANFGLNGQQPSHPELLDWLAAELVENQWRMKPLHRRIVLSATYRQGSAVGNDDAERAIDPENRFLWRMNSRRMEAEVVRDSVLFTAGNLDLTRGGPAIPESQGATVPRRSLYFRNTPNETMQFLDSFDAPNPNECYRRRESVVPHQALALMNSSLAQDQARMLAEWLSEAVGGEDDPRTHGKFITAAFETLLTRRPTEQELSACRRFLKSNAAMVRQSGQTAFPAGDQTFARTPSTRPHQRARENLILVLYSHNDFVTIR